MALSDQDQARLDALNGILGVPQAPAPVQQEPMGLGQRILEQAVNLPVNAGRALGNLVADTGNMFLPDDMKQRFDDSNTSNFFNIPAPKTTGETLVDAGAGLVSSLPAYILPEAGIAKLAGGLGVPALASRVIGSAGAGYLNTQGTEGQAGGATQAGIMGTMSALGGLSRAARILPALGLGAVAGYTADQNGASPVQSIVQGGLVGALSMLHGSPAAAKPGTGFTLGEGGDPTYTGPQRIVKPDGTIVHVGSGNNFTMGDGQFEATDNGPIQPSALLYDRQLEAGQMPARQSETSQLLLPGPDGVEAEQGPLRLQDSSTSPNSLFQLGDGSDPSRAGNFTLGADTTNLPNGGVLDRAPQFQLMGRDEQIPAGARQLMPSPGPTPLDVRLPEGQGPLQLQLPTNRTQIISTAFQHSDGTVRAGSSWDQPHEAIGTMHDIDNVPQANRGFLVHNGDGTQQFMNRDDAYDIAVEAGQHRDPTLGKPLNSTDLQSAVPEKGSGDVLQAPPPAPDLVGPQSAANLGGGNETSQPAASDADDPHTAAMERLRRFGSQPDPYAALQQASPANRKTMFDAVRQSGRKAGTVKKLAEIARQLHTDSDAPVAADTPPAPEPPTPPSAVDVATRQAAGDTPSKPAAALSGEPDVMTADASHLDADAQEEVSYRRDLINDPNQTKDDIAYHTGKLREAFGLPEQPEVPLPAQDSPRPLETSQSRAVVPRGASWLYDDSVKSDSRGIDQGGQGWHDQAPEATVPYEQDPAENTKQIVNKTIDDGELTNLRTALGGGEPEVDGGQKSLKDFLLANDTPDYDDSFKPSDEDMAASGAHDEAERASDEALDQNEAMKGESMGKPDHVAALMDAIRQADPKLMPESEAKPEQAKKIRKGRAAKKAVRGILSDGLGGADGFVDNQLLGYMGRFGAGALIGGNMGYNMDKENHIRGAILGAALLGLGAAHAPQLWKLLSKSVPDAAKEQVRAVRDVTSQPGANLGDFVQNAMANNHTGTDDLLVRRVLRDLGTNFTRSEDVREVIQMSNTAALQDMADRATKGMFDTGEYEKMTPAERASYEKFRESGASIDQTNWTVKEDDPLAVTQFMADLSAHPRFAAGAVIERNVRMIQQATIAKSGALGALRQKILDTIGKYSTDSYRIFSSRWKPSDLQISNAVDSLKWLDAFPGYSKTLVNKYVGRWLEGIYQNRGMYEGGAAGGESGTLDQLLKRKAGGLSDSLTQEILSQQPTAKSVDEVVSSGLYLKPETRTKLWNAIKSGEYITPQWRDLMGQYTDPRERSVATMMKLMPAVRAAKMFDILAAGKNDLGMDFAMSPKDLETSQSTIQAQLKTATDPKIIKNLQRQLIDLNNRVWLPSTENLGILSDKMVSPEIANVLPDMNKGALGGSTGPVMNAVMEGTKAIKLGQTLLNPISYVRWAWNAPFLGAVAGNSPMDIINGFKAIRGFDAYGSVKERLTNLGVIGADLATNDFNATAKRALTGNLDQNIMDRFLGTNFMRKAADIYSMSDNSIRAGTFLRREQEMLSKFAPDVAAGRTLPDGRVMTQQIAAQMAEKEAIRYTNRYTVDYGNVPGGLAAMRKMPFFSLYLTYSYETSRILKNIVMDAAGKGPYGKEAQFGAMTKLATMATVPAAITAAATGMMSDQDQKDWAQTKKLMQPYAQPRWMVPLGKRADGSFRYIDLTPLDPVGDWSSFGRAVASGDWRQVVASNPYIGTDNTPALNVATEIITGTNQRTGRPINSVGRALDATRQEIAPAFVGGYEFDNLMRALQPNDEGGMGVQRLGSGKGYSISDLLTTYATGIRPTTVNTNWSRKTTVDQAQSDISTERQFMMDTMMSNASQDAKVAAQQRYKDAVTMIVARLHTKIDAE